MNYLTMVLQGGASIKFPVESWTQYNKICKEAALKTDLVCLVFTRVDGTTLTLYPHELTWISEIEKRRSKIKAVL